MKLSQRFLVSAEGTTPAPAQYGPDAVSHGVDAPAAGLDQTMGFGLK